VHLVCLSELTTIPCLTSKHRGGSRKGVKLAYLIHSDCTKFGSTNGRRTV